MSDVNLFNLWPALSSVLPPTCRAVTFKSRGISITWLYSAFSSSMLLIGFTARCFMRWYRYKYKQDARSIVLTLLSAAPTIAFAGAVRPEPPRGWSRPPEDIDDGRKRDAEGLIDGSMSRVEESNRIAVEEDGLLDLDSAVQYDFG